MRVFTPGEVARHAANKYLGVLVAAKYARVLNEYGDDSVAQLGGAHEGALTAMIRLELEGLR